MKLLTFIVSVIVLAAFIGVNIRHTSDIRVWFGEKGLLRDVPILVSFFVVYLMGVLSSIPFMVSWKRKQSRKNTEISAADENSEDSEDSGKRKSVRVLGGGRRKARRDEQDDEVSSPAEPSGHPQPESGE